MKVEEGLTAAVEEGCFGFGRGEFEAWAEGGGGEEGERQKFAFGENAKGAFEPDGDEFDFGTAAGEVVDAGLEVLQGVTGIAGAFGEDDEGVAFVECLGHSVEGIFLAAETTPVDQEGAEDFVSEEAAERGFVPVISGADRAGAFTDFAGKRGPDQEEVEVATMVSVVNAWSMGVGGGVEIVESDASEGA